MKLRKFFNLIVLSSFVIFFLISISLCNSQHENFTEEISITPEKIFSEKIPGDFFEEKLNIKNNKEEEVLIRIREISGSISKVLPSVDKIWVKIKPKEEKSLSIRGYVNKDAEEGEYSGNVALESDGKIYKIPINLRIIKFFEKISLGIKIEPSKREFRPGELITVKTRIENKGHKTVKGELELNLLNSSKGIVAKKIVNFSVTTIIDEILEISLPANISEGKYELVGNLYYTKAGKKSLKSSDAVEISIRKPWTDIFIPILNQITLSRVTLSIFILIIVILFYFLFKYYQKERSEKRRYLESILKSIKFETLPKSGPRSGFIGRIAETNIKAFFYIDELKNHTLIAGSTGTGKTVCAQLLAEEALMKNASVIVFDPTAQWTGFLRKNRDPRIFKLYSYFGMSVKQARSFKGNIRVISDPSKKIKIKENINPGEITIFTLNKLDSTQIETFVINTIDQVYKENFEESKELKLLLIYDEIHRILPKFGGMGKGLTWLEKGVREFRKWGIGIILISQVLSDFVGEIKANIGTEIQLMTRYEGDLNRIKLKYGEDVHKSVVKAAVGEGMIQNSEYNRGNPYFVRFRPPLHSLKRLDDETLDKYNYYTQRIDSIEEKINEIKKADIDVFDVEIELNLAMDNLKEGMFGVVDLYLETLDSRVNELMRKLKEGKIKEEERAIISEWDKKKEEVLRKYEEEIRKKIEAEREALEKREEELKRKREEELKRVESRRLKLLEAERERAKEVEEERNRLEKRARVLELLSKYEKLRELLREDIFSREKEKLEKRRQELKELKEPLLREMRKERMKSEKERERIIREMKEEEEEVSRSIKRIEEMWNEIQKDEQIILSKDRELCKEEWKLIENIKNEIKEEIEKRRLLREELAREQEKWRKEELKLRELEMMEEFEKKRQKKMKEERAQREKIKKEKDRLYEEFEKIREKWLNVLEKEREMKKREDNLKKMKKELKRREIEREEKEREIEELKLKKSKEEEKVTATISDEEFNQFKNIVDSLLEKLNEKDIEEFTMSNNFKLYESVITTKESVDDKTKKKFIRMVDELLEKLPKEEIEKFVRDKEKYSLYKKVANWGES